MNQKINHLAVWVLVIVHQLIPMAWYSAFAEQWMKMNNITMAEIEQGGNNPIPYIVALVVGIITNYGLAHLFSLLKINSLAQGLATGAFIWFCFQIGDMATINLFSDRPFGLTLINGGHTFLNFVVSGAILGAWVKYRK
jgi:Protein of unknown function (DUF1761)